MRIAYKLFQEWVVDDSDDWDTLDSQTNGGADHRVPVDLSYQWLTSYQVGQDVQSWWYRRWD